MPLVASVRRMFDLDANPAVITDALASDPTLAELLARFPGQRAPGHWSLFEAAVRAVTGQQVSTGAARAILARLASAAAPDKESLAFPTPAALASLDHRCFPMPRRRVETLRQVSRLFDGQRGAVDVEALAAIPGIGPWTTAMIALRGSGDPDSLPPGDRGLERAWAAHRPGTTELTAHAAAHWRPWRAYAANLLWRSLKP